MNFPLVQRILGLLLMVFSLTMLPPMFVSWLYNDGNWNAFLDGALLIFFIGGLIFFPVRRARGELKIRDGFMIVCAFWIGLGLAGCVPLLIADLPVMGFSDAVFESVSGLTTTGATVLVGLDTLPHSILYYRQQLQWLGGMGIIVLAVAILPLLGVGGMQLYRAEFPGPVKDTKLTPRITQTARALWVIYLILTVACAVAYRLAGMDWFDAIGHSFSTVAIGGFSTHDASIGWFDSTAVEMVCIAFMFLAGINFSLHFVAWQRIRPLRLEHRPAGLPRLRWRSRGQVSPRAAARGYLLDPEFRAYATVLGGLFLIVTVALKLQDVYPTWQEALTKGLFQVVSIGTTTGFSTADFSDWPRAVPVLLILASFIGGCAGSTGGGIKVIRWVLIYKQGVREMSRLLHPAAEIPVRLGTRGVPPRVVEAVWGFFSTYVVVFGALMAVLMFFGLDQVTAFSAIAATLNNLGPGLGDVAQNYAGIGDLSKWVCVAAMVLGRLEIFTLLVLFTSDFWRQ